MTRRDALHVREAIRALEQASAAYVLTVAALVALVGWAAFNYATRQWAVGLWVTGMNTPTFWGIYIVNFVLFIGLSAGGILVAALVHAVGIERFRPVARIAEILAISCLILATIFIMLDLGRPDRFYHLLLYGRLGSPLVWDVIVIGVYLVISMGLGYFSTRGDIVACMHELPRRQRLYRVLALGYTDVSPGALARDRKILRGLAFAAIPAAVGLHSITAWIFGLVKARAGWHSALIAPLFVVSAIVSGLALVTLATIVCRRVLVLPIERRVIKDLGMLLAFLIPVLGYLLFAELLTVVYGGESAPFAVLREMAAGRYAPVFWFNALLGLLVPLLVLVNPPRPVAIGGAVVTAVAIGVVTAAFDVTLPGLTALVPTAVGVTLTPVSISLAMWTVVVVVPMLLLVSGRELGPGRIGFAAALVVLGVMAERTNIVLPSLLVRLMPYPDGARYWPTSVELSLVLGTYALGVLAFAVLAKLFPLVEMRHHADAEP